LAISKTLISTAPRSETYLFNTSGTPARGLCHFGLRSLELLGSGGSDAGSHQNMTGLADPTLRKKCFLAMWQKNKSINIYQLCIMDQSGYTEKAAGIHHIIMLLTYFLDNVL
jgi:hypothetical protein